MNSSCELCKAPKAPKTCGECGIAICKNCVRFLANDHMRFHPDPPPWSQKGIFCVECFERDVAPELERYDEVAARAENVKVVFDTYHGFIPCLKKAKETVRVEKNDLGKGIALQRLKFLAAWQGFDAVIETKVEAEKVRNHG